MSATKYIVSREALHAECGWVFGDGIMMVERGMHDALDALPIATENPYYVESYQRFKRMRLADEGSIVLGLCIATRCQCCGAVYGGAHDFCNSRCDNREVAARIERGLVCIHGPDATGDAPLFLSYEDLRRKSASGIRIMDESGDCYSLEILH